MVQMKGIGEEPIFVVTIASRAMRMLRAKGDVREGQMPQPMNARTNSLMNEAGQQLEAMKNIEGSDNGTDDDHYNHSSQG